MVGDRSDNIPGVPRIGKVTAEKILKNGSLGERMLDQKFKDNYMIGYNLIKMRDLKSEKDNIQFWESSLNKDGLSEVIQEYQFKSLENNKYIEKFAILL